MFTRESMFYSKKGDTFDKKMCQISIVEVKDEMNTTLVTQQIDLAPYVGKQEHKETLKLYDDSMMGLYIDLEWTI